MDFNNNNSGMPNDTAPVPQQAFKPQRPKKKIGKILVLFLVLLIVIGASYIVWRITTDKQAPDNSPQANISYLQNDNNIACVVTGAADLECEDLTSGDTKKFILPESYRNTSSITSSPDGSRLLIETGKGAFVVTNTDFKEVKTVLTAEQTRDRFINVMWADSANTLLINEIAREEGDADFLPEPLVIKLFDITTGESHRVYKTGEKVDLDSVAVLGSNGEYVFVTHSTAKNWVAKETNEPPKTIHAVRLSDGLVRVVNSHQFDLSSDLSKHINNTSITYDSLNKAFVFVTQDENGQQGQLKIATLEDGEFGLVLRKQQEINLDQVNVDTPLVLTVKGLQLNSLNEEASPVKLVSDSGSQTELKLQTEQLSRLISLKQMPNLPTAE